MMSTAKTEIVDADTGIAMHPALTFALAASFLFCVL
ncbi:hypothetical protein DIPPA_26525 [Diplonema papillatum]|nr:hypothetical protein DIPPA_26525 [Diplonema papillatum]